VRSAFGADTGLSQVVSEHAAALLALKKAPQRFGSVTEIPDKRR
jgi:hypothetical protein